MTIHNRRASYRFTLTMQDYTFLVYLIHFWGGSVLKDTLHLLRIANQLDPHVPNALCDLLTP